MNTEKFSKAIENEAQYHETSKILSAKKHPPAILRLLMNSFERYRQARKFGWSRPWNKVDLMNFQSFKLNTNEYPCDGEKCESATLCLGRKNNKCYRDCIDIIVESLVIEGVNMGVQRCRIFIDSYNADHKEPLWRGELKAAEHPLIENLFTALSHISWYWNGNKKRVWDHWTSAYINYFSERQWSLPRSYFFISPSAHAHIKMPLPDTLQLDGAGRL